MAAACVFRESHEPDTPAAVTRRHCPETWMMNASMRSHVAGRDGKVTCSGNQFEL
jgi:hypothetical protein